MRIKFNKEIEFYLKKIFFSQKYLLKKRLERSIKNNDEEEIKLVKSFITPNTDSIDVGVYRGVYSYEMSKYSKLVHSFEPNPILFNNIEKDLKKIIKNIKFYNNALSDKDGLMSLKIPIRNKSYDKKNYEEYFQMGKASIHNKNDIDEFESFDIKSKLLDSFNFTNKISFIKIDVEGHEQHVLEGGINLIKKDKPNLLIEIEKKHRSDSIEKTFMYLDNLGYKPYTFKNNKLNLLTDVDNSDSVNYIFKVN